MTIPTFIPLNEAAARTGWTVERLRELVAAGTIMAGKLPDGEVIIAVDANGTAIETPAEAETSPQSEVQQPQLPLAAAGDDINAQLAAIKRDDFKHLKGQGITVSEAARKYDVNRSTILKWTKQQYIAILKPGYRMELDEADVAYCATIHAIRRKTGVRFGAPLLDETGMPYLLKHPALSRYRREQKKTEAATV